MTISFIDAYHGTETTFELNGKKLKIKIKPGIKEAQQLNDENKAFI